MKKLDWLVQIRNEKGLTQIEVAKNAGVTTQWYWAIENGESVPSVSTAKAIAQILGFNWTRFFD